MPSSAQLSKLALLISDFVAFALAFGCGCLLLIQYGHYEEVAHFNVWWDTTGLIHTSVHFLFVVLCLLRFYSQGLYSKRLPFWDELRIILMTLFYLSLLNGMVVLVAKWPFSRVLWLGSWSLSFFFIPFLRSRTRSLLRRLGVWTRPTIIVGSGQNALDAMAALKSEPQLGFEVSEFLSIHSRKFTSFPGQTPLREVPKAELIPYLRSKPSCEVFLALDESELTEAGPLIEEMGLYFPELFFVPTLAGLPLFGMDSYHFFSHELLILRSKNNLNFRPQSFVKRLFDVSVSLTLFALLSPLLLWIAISVRLSGPGIVYSHRRIGRNGKSFPCYKFRSMIPNADKVLQALLEKDPVARRQWNEKMKIENDPRVTGIGQFLRRTSLDELPQLWNVLKGDMSLVGPRPIVDKETERYGQRLEFYHRVRPGITGLWQVSGRSDTDYSTRVRLDTWYSKNWSLWYDFAILFKTVKIVIDRKGAY